MRKHVFICCISYFCLFLSEILPAQIPGNDLPLNQSITEQPVNLTPDINFELYGLPSLDFLKGEDFKETKKRSKDNPDELAILGDMYRLGWQMNKPNTRRAYKSYQEGTEAGSQKAKHRLAYMYAKGIEVPRQDTTFTRMIFELAEQGFDLAQVDAGTLYLKGLHGIAVDWPAALDWYKEAANNGNRDAMRLTGNLYIHQESAAHDIQLNLVEAKNWLRKADATEDVVYLHNKLSDFGSFRYLCSKYPGFVRAVDVDIDYTDIDQVEDLTDKLSFLKDLLNPDIVDLYIHELKNHLLHSQYEKTNRETDKLIKLLVKLESNSWLKPESKQFKKQITSDIVETPDYLNALTVRKLIELINYNHFESLKQPVINRYLETNFEAAREKTDELFHFYIILIEQDWHKPESEKYIPEVKKEFLLNIRKVEPGNLTLYSQKLEESGQHVFAREIVSHYLESLFAAKQVQPAALYSLYKTIHSDSIFKPYREVFYEKIKTSMLYSLSDTDPAVIREIYLYFTGVDAKYADLFRSQYAEDIMNQKINNPEHLLKLYQFLQNGLFLAESKEEMLGPLKIQLSEHADAAQPEVFIQYIQFINEKDKEFSQELIRKYLKKKYTQFQSGQEPDKFSEFIENHSFFKPFAKQYIDK